MLKYEFRHLTADQKKGIINTNICSYTFEAVESCVFWTPESFRLWETFTAVGNFFCRWKTFFEGKFEAAAFPQKRKKKKKKEKVAKRNKEKEKREEKDEEEDEDGEIYRLGQLKLFLFNNTCAHA